MSIKKSLIQEAILEAREIEKIATEKARKAIEEEMAPRIKQVANEALKEFEMNSINEGMNLEIPDGAELTIKMPEDETGAIENEISDENTETEELDLDGNVESEEITNNKEEDMSDIFEIEGLNEVDDTIQPAAGETTDVAAPAAAPDLNADTEALPAEETVSLESVNQKLDDVLAKLDSFSMDDSTEEGEGDVSIIEDEPEAAPAPTELPAETPAAPVQEEEEFELESEDEMDEEVVYEVEDDNSDSNMLEYELEEEDMSDINSESMMEMFKEIEGLDEIEIIDEEELEDETIEEMLGVSQALKHSTLGKLPKNEINESLNKLKAQYGSKIDELNQENESLKQTIKEYKDSFIVLRKQINEVQIFNAKLAYANKLFTNGGLTNDEKMKIAEDFDSVETIEEAKKLYNNLLNEMKISKSPKNPSIDKLKSVGPAVIKSSNAQTLFESDEMRRMKRLAGINKRSED